MLDPSQRQRLLMLARQSILAGLQENMRTACVEFPHDGVFDAPRASFVTLHLHQNLRGCCGSLEPVGALAEDVWRNAWAAAFSDPRFPPLTDTEYDGLDVHVSVLSPLELIPAGSEADLLRQLRPGIDGVVLRRAFDRATFLPAVWEQLRDPVDFVRQLKLKAGWSADAWPADLQVWRYTTESFGEP